MPLLTIEIPCEEMHESNALLEESVRTLMLEMDMLHEERLSTLQEAGCFFWGGKGLGCSKGTCWTRGW